VSMNVVHFLLTPVTWSGEETLLVRTHCWKRNWVQWFILGDIMQFRRRFQRKHSLELCACFTGMTSTSTSSC
jgi:hypothetical protein